MTSSNQASPNREWLDRIRDRWDGRAEWWDEMSEANAHTDTRQTDLDRTTQALALTPGLRLLDAGCGTGQYAIAFAKRGYVVSAIDIAPAMIERARDHATRADVTVDWRVGDYTALVASDEPYDAIHARVSLQFVAEPTRTLRALRKALKPGGRLYVSVPGAASPIYSSAWRRFLPNEPGTIHYITPWDLERLLNELSFTVLDQWGDVPIERQQELTGTLQSAEDRLRILQTLSLTWSLIAEK